MRNTGQCSFKSTAIALGVVAAISAGSIAVASGDTSSSPAEQSAGAGALSPQALAALRTGDPAQRGVDPSRASSVRAGSATWHVVPTDDGSCLVTEDGTVTCASASNVQSGTLLSVEVARVPRAAKPQALTAIFRGVAPRGAVEATAVDSAGRALASAEVSQGVYRLDLTDVRAVAAVRLTDASGAVTTQVPLGS